MTLASSGNGRHPAGGHLRSVGGLQRPGRRAGALLLEGHQKVPTRPTGAYAAVDPVLLPSDQHVP